MFHFPAIVATIFISILPNFLSSSKLPPPPPVALSCNYQFSPVISVSTPSPIFRWQLTSEQVNQTAYQIQLYNEATNLLLFDTETTTSSSQQYIYAGPTLNSTTIYQWIIRTWNEGNQPSSYSLPAVFVTGLFASSDWKSSAIWHPNSTAGFVFFRNTFTLPIPVSQVHRILTFITANPQGSTNGEKENSKLLGAYRLYINNQWIGMGPGRPGTCGPVCPVGNDPGVCFCTPEHIYEGYDITDASLTNISTYNNIVTIAIQSFNYPPRSNNYAVNFTSKVATEFYIVDTVGQIYHISSLENTWKAYNADTYFGQPACCVSDPAWYLQPTENIDANLEPVNWRLPLFNGSNTWETAVSLSNFATDSNFTLVARPTSPLIITQNVQPAVVLTLGPGHYFIDLGKEIQGGLSLSWDDTTNPLNGSMFQVRLGEELLTTDPPSVRYQMRTGNNYLNTWTLRNGSQTLEHHEYLEFRYVELIDTTNVGSTCERSATGDYSTSITLSCGADGGSSVISNFVFADWGTPNGICLPQVSPYANNFTVNASCSYSQTVDVLNKLCLGKSSCTFTPSDELFGNTDPCDKIYKWLAVVANCTGTPPSPSNNLPLPSSISAWVLTYPAVYSTLPSSDTLTVPSSYPGLRGPALMTYKVNRTGTFDTHKRMYPPLSYPGTAPPTQLVSSSDDLNNVWNLCSYTVVATALDMYTDSNTRQRSVICAEALHINILMQFATSYEVSMQTYTLLYTINMRPTSLGWAEWQALTIYSVYTVYQYTGDLSLFIQYYDHLRYFTELSLIDNTTGLWTADEKTFNSNNPEIDWPSGMRDGFVFVPVDTVVNAYTYRAMVYFVEMAQAIGGHDNDVTFFTAVANRLRDAMNTQLFIPSLGYYSDGQGTNHTAWHSSVYALAFGIPTAAMIPTVLQYVVNRSIGDPSLCQPGNVYPAQWALEAFYQDNSNHGLYGLQLLLCTGNNSWLSLLAQNNTMTSEAWSPEEKPNETRSHSWAASPADIIPRFVLGVRPFLPGFTKLIIQPQIGTLSWINGVVPTLKGPVYVNITQNSTLNTTINKLSITGMTIQFTVPGNTVSIACLPIQPCTINNPPGNQYGITIDGTLVTNTVVMDDSVCVDNIGPGNHEAVCSIPTEQ